MTEYLSDIAAALGLSVPERLSRQKVSTLLTDSRSLASPEGTLFFALRSETADGHSFIRDLYDKGVRLFVVNKEIFDRDLSSLPMEEATFLPVEDTLAALQSVGALHRRNARKVLAITGSRGKTSLKEWLSLILSSSISVSRSPRSYNSQIGVPLSLWGIPEETDLAVIEAGISRPGEMENLRNCIHPDAVILTNLLSDHSEGFPSEESKLAEKLSLAGGEHTRLVILPWELAKSHPLHTTPISWSFSDEEGADLSLKTERKEREVTVTYRWDPKSSSTEYSAPETGSFTLFEPKEGDIENAASALAFLLASGYGSLPLIENAASLRHIRTRLDVSEGVNGCLVADDSYTSDLSSLQPALEFIRRRRASGQSLTLILSDLTTERLAPGRIYPEVARLIAENGIDRFIGVGPDLEAHRELFPTESRFFNTSAELLASLSPSDFNHELILLKGSPEFRFDNIRESLVLKTHETVLEVNLNAIVENYNYFRSHVRPGTGLVAMVKASGYGAGSREIAKTLQDCGAAYLAVAVLDEGIDLRDQGITMPIMVMNPKVVNYRQMFAHRLEPEVYSLEMLADVIREGGKCGVTDYPIHLKLDTGMHRMGLVEEELPRAVEMIEAQGAITVRSVFSHLATADCPDLNEYTELQLDRFRRYTDFLAAHLSRPFLRHVLNSAGILRYPEHDYDMVRLGIGLYGVNTLPPEMEKPLAPVSTLLTPIIALREWKAGESIGYARKTILKRDSRIATLPIGYADGMNRHFGNGNIKVLVNGKEAPTAGNICMDACMIDVTGIDCKVGDIVEIFGPNAPVTRLSDLLETIPYEILTSVSPRVKRLYYRE